MAKDMNFSLLLDFYSDTLGEKQKEIMLDYYYEDLSLSEISENRGITRQGVRDSIKRSQNHLTDIESKLNLLYKFNETQKNINVIKNSICNIKEKTTDKDIMVQLDVMLKHIELIT